MYIPPTGYEYLLLVPIGWLLLLSSEFLYMYIAYFIAYGRTYFLVPVLVGATLPRPDKR